MTRATYQPLLMGTAGRYGEDALPSTAPGRCSLGRRRSPVAMTSLRCSPVSHYRAPYLQPVSSGVNGHSVEPSVAQLIDRWSPDEARYVSFTTLHDTGRCRCRGHHYIDLALSKAAEAEAMHRDAASPGHVRQTLRPRTARRCAWCFLGSTASRGPSRSSGSLSGTEPLIPGSIPHR